MAGLKKRGNLLGAIDGSKVHPLNQRFPQSLAVGLRCGKQVMRRGCRSLRRAVALDPARAMRATASVLPAEAR